MARKEAALLSQRLTPHFFCFSLYNHCKRRGGGQTALLISWYLSSQIRSNLHYIVHTRSPSDFRFYRQKDQINYFWMKDFFTFLGAS